MLLKGDAYLFWVVSVNTFDSSLRQLNKLVNGPFEGFSSEMVNDIGPLPFPTSSIWYSDTTRTKKIIECVVQYNSNMTIASEARVVYAQDGVTPLLTITDVNNI